MTRISVNGRGKTKHTDGGVNSVAPNVWELTEQFPPEFLIRVIRAIRGSTHRPTESQSFLMVTLRNQTG